MRKSFGLWSAVFLGIGSMVGAGIFVLLGEAGAIAGNLVWISFILGGLIALGAGYSLAKLASLYPSRGGMVEYLVQCYGEGVFSGSISVLFYISSVVGIAMVSKTFGTYASEMFHLKGIFYVNSFSIGILLLFAFINLIGSSLIAKSENVIVILKLTIIVIFSVSVLFYMDPSLLSLKDAPKASNIFSAVSLTFFAYAGFSVITNTVEDMENSEKTVMKAMIIAIGFVIALYILVTFAVFGNLTLDEIIKAKDYALAEAAMPVFGKVGFTVMAIAALISTSSSINANLYATTNIAYQMAKDGDLPEIYDKRFYNSTQGLVVTTVLLIVLILFFNLNEIATAGSIFILFIHIFVHLGHFFKIDKTKASKLIVGITVVLLSITVVLAISYASKHVNDILYYIVGGFVLSFLLEVFLRLYSNRVVLKQIKEEL